MAGDLGTERNRVVVRYKNGKMAKGFTHDFKPTVSEFHITSDLAEDKGKVHTVKVADLKAVFFVKKLEGSKEYHEKKTFADVDTSHLRGLKVKVEFTDGEVLRGTTLGYAKGKKGFFLIPVDPKSNNDRVYVVGDAVRSVVTGLGAEK
jgi:hypothetical protein